VLLLLNITRTILYRLFNDRSKRALIVSPSIAHYDFVMTLSLLVFFFLSPIIQLSVNAKRDTNVLRTCLNLFIV